MEFPIYFIDFILISALSLTYIISVLLAAPRTVTIFEYIDTNETDSL